MPGRPPLIPRSPSPTTRAAPGGSRPARGGTRPARGGRRRHAAGATALLLAAVTLLAGCGRSVAVDAPTPAPGQTAACGALLDALPDRVDDAARRPVTPDAGTTAAWGDPPITLRCGVAAPTPAATAELLTVSGVDWLPEPLTAGVRFTTVGRSPTVIVDVPTAYAPEASALADLADSLGRSLTVTRR